MRSLRAASKVAAAVTHEGDNPFSSVNLELSGKKLSIRGGDGKVEVFGGAELTEECPDDTEVMLLGKTLMQFCEALGSEGDNSADNNKDKGPLIHFSVKEGQAEIKAGSQRMQLNVRTGVYPKMEIAEEDPATVLNLVLSAQQLSRLIKKTDFAVLRVGIKHRPALTGVLLEVRDGILRAVATDGLCMALCDETVVECKTSENNQFILPPEMLERMNFMLESLAPDSNVELYLSRSSVRVTSADTDSRISAKLIDAPFPPYNRPLDYDFNKSIIVDKQLLGGAMRRANVVFNGSNDGVPCCLLKIENNQMSLYSKNAFGDVVDETIAIDQKCDSWTAKVKIDFIKRGLDMFDEPSVQFSFVEADKPLRVNGASSKMDLQYLIMPMS